MTDYYVDSATGSNANAGTASGSPKKYLRLDDGNNSLLTAVTLTASDTVYIKSGHSETVTAAITIAVGGASIVTVDSLSSPTAYGSKGNAFIGNGTPTSGYDIIVTLGGGLIQGLDLTAGDELDVSSNPKRGRIVDCVLGSLRTGGYNCTIGGLQNSVIEMYNTDAYMSNQDLVISGRGSSLKWFGGAITKHSTYTPRGIEFSSEGGHIELYGVNFELMARLLYTFHTESGDEAIFSRCKLPSTIRPVTWNNEQWAGNFYNCNTADGYYEFRREEYVGTVYLDTANARTATYDDTNKYSVLMSPNTDVTQNNSLRFMLTQIPSVDLTTAQTVTVELSAWNSESTPAAIQDDEFWIEVVSTDGTDLALGEMFTSGPIEVFGTPADLTTSTETWVKTTNIVKHKVSVDLDAVTGADDVPLMIFACYAKASVPINVCPDVDVSAT